MILQGGVLGRKFAWGTDSSTKASHLVTCAPLVHMHHISVLFGSTKKCIEKKMRTIILYSVLLYPFFIKLTGIAILLILCFAPTFDPPGRILPINELDHSIWNKSFQVSIKNINVAAATVLTDIYTK